jgi:hypothetical protein
MGEDALICVSVCIKHFTVEFRDLVTCLLQPNIALHVSCLRAVKNETLSVQTTL